MSSRETALKYGVALGVVALTLALTMLGQSYLNKMPDAPFVAAVAVAAWYGGMWPGLLSTVLSALAVDYFLVPPLYEINVDAGHIIRLCTFVAVSLIVSSLQQSLRAARLRAEAGEQTVRAELAERERIEGERLALLAREREARERAEAAQRRLAFIADASRLVAASLDSEATLPSLGRLAVPALSDWCITYLVQADGGIRQIQVMCPSDPQAESLAADFRALPLTARLKETPVGRRVFGNAESVLFVDLGDEMLHALAESEAHESLLRRWRACSLMIVPFREHRRVLGAILFACTSSGRRFSTEDLALAEEVAGRAAAALVNAQLYQQAQDANRMKDEFLATVSHELRTPLHAILGWSRLLRNSTLGEAAANRALETIERNAQAQAQLVGDILDVSRIVTGKLKLDMRPVTLATIVESALDAIRPSAHAKGIEIEAHVPDPKLSVLADPARLQQIVWNLLSNAVKFTQAGGHVEVGLRRKGSEAEIAVADTGIGIERGFLPYVFDRFRQEDSSTSRAHGGLGLGLAIVRHLAELHGGSVRAESEGRGCGATFTLRLPLAARARRVPAVRPPSSPSGLQATLLHGLHVLAVDDQSDARELIAASLERCGATVTTIGSAREALASLDTARADVLIADIGMPDEDGYALIRQVRGRPEERGGTVPAIALTAYARREDEARAIEAGYQVHLAKPIADRDLIEAVATLAGRAIA